MASRSGATITGQRRKRNIAETSTINEGPSTAAKILRSGKVVSTKVVKKRPNFVKPNPDPDFQPSAAATKAMRNVLVLEKIAETLPPKEMFTLRSTCPLWNRSFVPQLKKKHTPLGLQALTNVMGGTGPVSQLQTRSQFIDVIRSSSTQLFPFTRDRCEPQFDENEQMTTRPEKLIELFTEIGSSITSLTNVNNIPAGILQKILFKLTAVGGGVQELMLQDCSQLRYGHKKPINRLVKPLPSLKKLTFAAMTDDTREVAIELLHSAVKLESLELIRSCSSNLLVALQQTVPHGQLQNLKTLNIDRLDFERLSILVDLARMKEHPLRLECLDASLKSTQYCQDPGQNIRLINEFLVMQSTGLLFLKLDITCPAEKRPLGLKIPIQLPRMERLQSLDLLRSDSWPIRVDCKEDSFEHNFPSLRRFGYAKDYWAEEKRVGGVLAEDLKQISHTSVNQLHLIRVPEESLPAFGAAFPGVTRLEINLCGDGRDETFHQIWIVWPGLTKLSVCIKYRNPDSFLLGVPQTRLRCLQRELAFLPVLNLDNLLSVQSKYKTMPGLTDLRELRHLDFDVCNKYDGNQRVTNIGAYFGLALAPKLQHISVRTLNYYDRPYKMNKKRSRKDLDSEECKWFLRSVFGPFAVIDV